MVTKAVIDQRKIHDFFYRVWYEPGNQKGYLKPLSSLYAGFVTFNRWLFKQGLREVYVPPVPLIVVGNIHVGGGGKSPMVGALFEYFSAQGFQVGIVSRGYRRESKEAVMVSEQSRVEEVGDEPKMLFEQTGAPVAVDANRGRAVRYLLAYYPDVNLIICDDGLQHQQLARDVEIVMMPAHLELHNQQVLPSGPFREPPSRLKEVDFVLKLTEYQLLRPIHLLTGQPLVPWPYVEPVHAVAGIAHPKSFFKRLEALGVPVESHEFSDHHAFSRTDFAFDQGDKPLLMTEKDAVKCQSFAQENWYKVPLVVKLSPDIKRNIHEKLVDKAKKRGLNL